MHRRWIPILLAALAPAFALGEPVRIGVIAPFSGSFADYGKQFDVGIKAFQKIHGDTVAGRKVEIIRRDTGGPMPEVAKRLAQELVVRGKVDFLAGFGLTPEALAVADVATQARKPMVVFNAAASIIPTRSPYIVRTSMTLPQVSAPLGTWAARHGIARVVTLVADYGPGSDAEAAFKKTFTAGGGRIIEALRTPLQNPDFGPYIQRVKDAKPDAVFIFVPSGEQSIAVMKAYRERDLAAAGIKAIGTGDVTDDHILDALGDAAIGMITTSHYSAAHDSPENRAFLQAAAEVAPGSGRPNFMAVGAYDGMAAIYEVIRRVPGTPDADAAMPILRTFKTMSPRGPIAIDPATRDIVQDIHVRRVERRGGELWNIEFDRFERVADPGKPH